MFTHSKLDSVLCLLVLDDGSHLEVVLEGAGHVICSLAGLDTTLNTRTVPLLAQNTHQGPAGRLRKKDTLDIVDQN